MWLINGRSRNHMDMLQGISVWDVAIGFLGAGLCAEILLSSLPLHGILAGLLAVILLLLLVRLDREPNYIRLLYWLKYVGFPSSYRKHADRPDQDMAGIMASTGVRGQVLCYGDAYVGGVLELVVSGEDPEAVRQQETALAALLTSLPPAYCANLLRMNTEEWPWDYLVLFKKNEKKLNKELALWTARLGEAGVRVRRIRNNDLISFYKDWNIPADKKECPVEFTEEGSVQILPETLDIHVSSLKVNGHTLHKRMVDQYPSLVGQGWLSGLMKAPGTRTLVKCRPCDRARAVDQMDEELAGLRRGYLKASLPSERMELEDRISKLANLLKAVSQGQEALLETNIYITCSKAKLARKLCQADQTYPCINKEFRQLQLWIGSQISGYDPWAGQGRLIAGGSLAAGIRTEGEEIETL